MRIVVSAGGTGGHIYPALAIIKKIAEKEKNTEVLFIGTHNRMEKEIVPKYGYKYEELVIYGFSKTKILRNIKNVFYIREAYKKSRKLIKSFKPDIVIGTGGYVTYPVLKAAKKEKIKVFIHEQNSMPGKTNKILSNKADLVGVSFDGSKQYFLNAKEVFTSGNPAGSSAIETDKIKKEDLGFKSEKKLVIIVAGSLGSSTVNAKMKEFLKLKHDYEILYITGKNHYDAFTSGEKFDKGVKVVPYFDNLSGLLKSADLIVSRAGATTISEILALEIPSILIPSPFVANNHQYYNALDLVNMGVSILIEEKNLKTEKLLISINEIILNNERYQKFKNAFKAKKVIDSSEVIYNKIKEVIKSD